MSARDLPFPWNDYLRLQSAGDDRAANPASFGHDDALAAFVDNCWLTMAPTRAERWSLRCRSAIRQAPMRLIAAPRIGSRRISRRRARA